MKQLFNVVSGELFNGRNLYERQQYITLDYIVLQIGQQELCTVY